MVRELFLDKLEVEAAGAKVCTRLGSVKGDRSLVVGLFLANEIIIVLTQIENVSIHVVFYCMSLYCVCM